MANPHKGEIAFEADGQRYVLHYSVDALCALEAVAGKGIVALIGELMDPATMSLTLARKVMWAGLHDHHPEIDEKRAGELIIAAGGLMKISKVFNAAFGASFPEAAKDKNPPKAGSPSGTGPRSSRPGRASGETPTPSGKELPAN